LRRRRRRRRRREGGTIVDENDEATLRWFVYRFNQKPFCHPSHRYCCSCAFTVREYQ